MRRRRHAGYRTLAFPTKGVGTAVSKREGVFCSMPLLIQCFLTPATYDGDDAMLLAFYHPQTYMSIQIGEDGSLASVMQMTPGYGSNTPSTRQACSIAT
jgi:hypothetical protein